jgi:hypothetical protein
MPEVSNLIKAWADEYGSQFPMPPPDPCSRRDKQVWRDEVVRNFEKYRYSDVPFAGFYRFMKGVNPRFRRLQIFKFWLFLCHTRPWEKVKYSGRPLNDNEWWEKHLSTRVWHSIADDLAAFEFESTAEKGFPRYKKNPRLMRNLDNYDWLEKGMLPVVKFFQERECFLRLIATGSVITKRDIQRKLKLTPQRCQEIIKNYEFWGIIKTKPMPHGSTWVYLSSTKAAKKIMTLLMSSAK